MLKIQSNNFITMHNCSHCRRTTFIRTLTVLYSLQEEAEHDEAVGSPVIKNKTKDLYFQFQLLIAIFQINY
jgi:hypothetical protein